MVIVITPVYDINTTLEVKSGSGPKDGRVKDFYYHTNTKQSEVCSKCINTGMTMQISVARRVPIVDNGYTYTHVDVAAFPVSLWLMMKQPHPDVVGGGPFV